MKQYPSYKDSGVEWIGEIPSHWTKNKFKFLFNEKKSTPNPSLNSGSISFGEVIFKDDESIPISTKLSYQEVLEGEFLINPLNLNYDLKSLRISLSKINVVVSQGYIVINSITDNESEFFKYLLREFDVRHLKSLGNGIRQTISFKHLSTEELPLPPLSEQQQIVTYLDEKTSQIDTLIQTKKRKIGLLKEYRTSLINEVVTKGLNPNVEMKDSGVEWIGEIPKGWSVNKVRWITSDHRQGFYSSKPYDSDGFRLVRITDINDDKTISVENSPFYNLPYSEISNFKLRKGDFLFPRTGGVGRFGIFNSDIPSIYGSFLIRFRYDEQIQDSLLKYYFESNYYLNQILKEIHGGVNQNVHVENIKDCIIIYPKQRFEQQEIVSYLDEQTGKVDEEIGLEEQKIELLKDYRTSLISDVVTGKINVQDEVMV